MCGFIVQSQPHQVANRVDEVLRTQRHFVIWNFLIELPIDSETTNTPQTIPVQIEEFFFEQVRCLVKVGRIPRTQSLIDAKQRLFVRCRCIFRKRLQDQRIFNIGSQFHGLDTASQQCLDHDIRQLAPGVAKDLTSQFVLLWIHNVFNRILLKQLFRVRLGSDLYLFRLMIKTDQCCIGGIIRRHGSQQSHRGELAALVDANGDGILLRTDQLNPAAAFRNDPARLSLSIATGRFLRHHKVNTGRTVQLTHNDAFCTINDELPAADHDRYVAEVHLLFDGLLFDQTQPDTKWHSIGQPQLSTFRWRVARLTQLVTDILEPKLTVIAFNWKDFAQNPFQPLLKSIP